MGMDGSFAWISDQKQIAVGLRGGFIKIYHMLRRTLEHTLKTGGEFYFVYGLTYFKNRRWLVGKVMGKCVKIWQLEGTWKQVHSITTTGKHPDCILGDEKEE